MSAGSNVANYTRNYYMFSKCLWKMYNSDDQLKTRYEPIEVDDILDSLDSAIEYLPKKKDNRFDPILEPHLKLTSIIHKLVNRGDLDVSLTRYIPPGYRIPV